MEFPAIISGNVERKVSSALQVYTMSTLGVLSPLRIAQTIAVIKVNTPYKLANPPSLESKVAGYYLCLAFLPASI